VDESKPAAKSAADAKPTKPETDRAKDERDREEQQQKLEAAVKALQDASAAKPGTASPAEIPR
jgi:hypothetical protein